MLARQESARQQHLLQSRRMHPPPRKLGLPLQPLPITPSLLKDGEGTQAQPLQSRIQKVSLCSSCTVMAVDNNHSNLSAYSISSHYRLL